MNRSLADDIRSRTDTQLATLLLARPDLARPAPVDLTSLAARAVTVASVRQAVERLDTGHLHVLEAMVVAGGATRPVQPEQVTALLGAATVAGQVERLHAQALLWRSPEGLRVVRAAAEALGPSPAGLGPPWAELAAVLRRPEPATAGGPGAGPAPAPASAQEVERVLAAAPAAALGIVQRLTWGPPSAVVPASGPVREGAEWLADSGIVVWTAADRVTLPREIALARRQGRLHRDVRLDPPPLDGPTPGTGAVDAAAGERIRAFLGLLDDLAHAWGSEPPRSLRSGGLSVRDLGRVAGTLDVGIDEAAFVVEVAHASGLVADEPATAAFLPTTAFDGWAGRGPGARWAVVASAWLASPRAAHLVGTSGRSGTINALGAEAHWPSIRQLRAEVLDLLATTETGSAVPPTGVVRRLAWNHPLRDPDAVAATAEAVLREAQWLGVTGAAGLSGPGRALAAGAGEAALAAAAEAVLAPVVDQVLLQADLTVVAPGPVGADVARFLRDVADVESRGGATVWRLSPSSIRRGLDKGLTADDLLGTFTRSSRTPVPQPLEYLVRDVARRHGQTRVGSATAYLRSDDEAVLAAIVADRSLAPALLRRIAPTVVVSQADPADLLDLLREGGYAPVQESADGSIVVSGPGHRRVQRSRRRADPGSAPLDPQRVADIVAALRAAPPRTRRSEGSQLRDADPVETTAALHELAESGDLAWLGYADANGRTTRRLVRVDGVDGGRVRVVDEVSGRSQVLLLHRITSAGSAESG